MKGLHENRDRLLCVRHAVCSPPGQDNLKNGIDAFAEHILFGLKDVIKGLPGNICCSTQIPDIDLIMLNFNFGNTRIFLSAEKSLSCG